MHLIRIIISCQLLLLLALTQLAACDRREYANSSAVADSDSDKRIGISLSASANTGSTSGQTALNIENTRYFFDVSDHSVEELQELLQRIEEITEASPETFNQLEIVMVLHGPDIDLFTRSNYMQNRHLIDLAAKLDAFRVVDMKVCETAMDSLGVQQHEIPAFIESVPYAPDEIQRLQREGYINL